ncbi:MAG TPA: hypothetical protein VL551_28845 [Actinospica sp.]|jgi:hypothetical protein|nr:hypothetical protein [Actinospica sp.]
MAVSGFFADADPCAALFGSVKQACENTGKLVNGTTSGSTSASSMLTDPLGSIAKSCAQAAAWVINQVSGAVGGNSGVDFTNSGFLKQYAIVFAASTILTVLLWMLAVIKRAVRGDAIVTAVTEATGFLWLAVGASAFTPVILYGMVTLTDSVTDAIGSTTNSGTNNFLSSFANTLSPTNGSNSTIGGGPILLIFISLVAMIAAAVLWLELLIRAAMLYVGAALAGAVYAGLVDKDLWPHVRRWAGLMIAVDMVKPVIVIVLGLATAISSGSTPSSSFASVLSGLAIMVLSIFASGLIYRFVPNFGDDMLRIAQSRGGDAPAQVQQGAMDGPATRMQQGIAAHGERAGNPVAAPAMAALGAGAGMAAQGLKASARLALQRPDPQVGTIGPGGIPGAGPGGPGGLPPQGPTMPSANAGRGAPTPTAGAGTEGTGA